MLNATTIKIPAKVDIGIRVAHLPDGERDCERQRDDPDDDSGDEVVSEVLAV